MFTQMSQPRKRKYAVLGATVVLVGAGALAAFHGHGDSPVNAAVAAASAAPPTEVDVAAVVAKSGDADIQLSFQAHAPRGMNTVDVGGKKLQCPVDGAFSQMVHFTMTTGGSAKTVTLSDGTKLTVSANREMAVK